jgi:hypothetical protein
MRRLDGRGVTEEILEIKESICLREARLLVVEMGRREDHFIILPAIGRDLRRAMYFGDCSLIGRKSLNSEYLLSGL